MDGLQWKIPLRWMICWYPFFTKPPYESISIVHHQTCCRRTTALTPTKRPTMRHMRPVGCQNTAPKPLNWTTLRPVHCQLAAQTPTKKPTMRPVGWKPTYVMMGPLDGLRAAGWPRTGLGAVGWQPLSRGFLQRAAAWQLYRSQRLLWKGLGAVDWKPTGLMVGFWKAFRLQVGNVQVSALCVDGF